MSSVLSDSSPPIHSSKPQLFVQNLQSQIRFRRKFGKGIDWKMKNIPELFRCPISLDLFADPVTLSTGQTYERASIEQWLAAGNFTCPVTMQRLDDTTLLPNHTLRHLIEQWLRAPSGSMPTVNLSALKQNLRSPASSPTTKLETLRIVKSLSSESSSGRAGLVQAGVFELLLQVLFQFPIADVNGEATELAVTALLNLLPSSASESLNMLTKGSNLAQLVFLLDEGNAKIKTGLCCLLEAIATCSATQELSHVLGRTQQVLQVLVSLLLDKSDHRASEASLGAVCSLCALEASRGNAIREGVVGGLIAYLLSSSGCSPIARNRRNGVTARAMATLELLLRLDAGKRKMMKTPNAIGVLVKMVFRVPSDQGGSEHAVEALIQLCCDSARARTEAINAGILTQLLLLLQSQCSHQAKAKARALLKLLRTMWVKDQGGF